MATRLAINGFGRIGRSLLRALMARPDCGLEVVAINDPAPIDALAHLFAFDSLHGRYPRPVTHTADSLDLGTGPIRITAETDPSRLNWRDVDILLECSGRFLSRQGAGQHLDSGAGRVLISAPADPEIPTVVYGVNHEIIRPDDRIISNASCTTNCLVPVVHVLDQSFGILRGQMTTVHSYTGTQPLHDRAQGDLYRARAAALSMIPTTTGAARTLGLILPDLAGRITGTAIRVPTPNVSCCDLVVETRQALSAEEVTAAMQSAADGPLRGVLGVETRPLVSTDYRQDPRSAIYAADQTDVQQDTLLRVLAWYDNEWAFSNRMLDVASLMAAQG